MKPTPDQALLLFGLLARFGESPQADLVPAVKKADRDQLVKAKLVEVVRVGRRLQLRLSDDGWAWAGDNLSAALPPMHGILQHFLARLAAHLAATSSTLADFVGRAPDEPETPAGRSNPPRPVNRRRTGEAAPRARATAEPKPPVPAKPAKQKRPAAAALRRRIEEAYLALTKGRRDESVRLAQLRHELGDLDRAIVDVGLARILKGDPKASLMRHDDPRQIDDVDRDAAFNPSGEPFHLIWIAS